MYQQRVNRPLDECVQLSSVLHNQLLHQVSNGHICEAIDLLVVVSVISTQVLAPVALKIGGR